MRYINRTTNTLTITLAAGALLVAGCGSDDVEDAVEQLGEADDGADDADEPETEPAGDTADDDTGDDTGDAEDGDDGDGGSAAEPDAASVEGRSIDTTVHQGGLEFTIEQMTVVDLDAEASPDGEVDQRVQGIELVFDASVLNPLNDTFTPSPNVSLRWNEAGTDNVVDVTGRAEFRQVPGNSTTSGEIIVPLRPDDLADYDDASARLVLGQSGRNPAKVPVGSDAELVDRFPVQQPLVDETFVVDDVLVTITAAEVRWDNPDGSHLDDGEALFELTYTMEERGGSQSCSTRGSGAFALTLPGGDSVVDLGVSERCVRGDQTETDVLTGFLIDGDFAGDYTIRHERGDDQDEIDFSLVATDGSPADQRTTR